MKALKKLLVYFISISIVLSSVFCMNLTQVKAASTPYSANGRLSVSGGQIVNSSGKTFTIKGVSTHGIAWYPDYISEASFKTLRDSYGVNTIRLAMYTSEYGGYCSGGDQSKLKSLINKGVKYATKLGMYVIIDWHILTDGNPLTYKSQALSFFKWAAQKYASYGNVLYEICNEPNGSGGTWKNIKSYAKSVIKTIRTYDKKAIIIVGTPTWSQDVDTVAADRITGYSNIAYSFHFYAATHTDSYRAKLESALKQKLPVIVTEFGISDASGNGTVNTSEGNKWIKLLNKYGIGRVMWNLSNKNESCALVKSSCTKTSGWTTSDLTASGKWLLKTYTGTQTAAASTTTTSQQTTTTSSSSATSSTSSSSSKTSASSSGTVKLKAVIKLVSSWQSGDSYYKHYTVTVKNTGSTTSSAWKVKIALSKSYSFNSNWSATFSKSGKTVIAKSLDWNKVLKKGESTEFGFIVKSSSKESVNSITITAK